MTRTNFPESAPVKSCEQVKSKIELLKSGMDKMSVGADDANAYTTRVHFLLLMSWALVCRLWISDVKC
jgi:hypothetical protein